MNVIYALHFYFWFWSSKLHNTIGIGSDNTDEFQKEYEQNDTIIPGNMEKIGEFQRSVYKIKLWRAFFSLSSV